MDTRRDRSTRPDPSSEDRGAEVEDLAVVNLDPGGRPPPWPAIGIAFIAVAVLAFALGAKWAPPAPTVAPPTRAGAAVASAVPSPTPTNAGFVPPTLAVPTPALPTLPPAGSWARADLLRDEGLTADNVWGVGDRIIVGARYVQPNGAFQTLSAVVLEPGRAWRSIPVPTAIGRLTGGAVIDDRLWFLARVDGVAPGDSTWRLVSTADGETWSSLPAATGLGGIDTVAVMGRVGSTWVVAAPDSGGGSGAPQLLRSPDGVRWTQVQLPDVGGVLSWDQIATIRDRLILLVIAGPPETAKYRIFSTVDGATWDEETFPGTLHGPLDLACSDERCVLSGIELSVSRMPVAWVSDDGRGWTESDTLFPADSESHGGLVQLAATANGFLGIEEDPRMVWLSTPDGRTWRSFDVMPPDNQDVLLGLAVAGDVIVALAAGDGPDVPPGVWRGSLSLLER